MRVYNDREKTLAREREQSKINSLSDSYTARLAIKGYDTIHVSELPSWFLEIYKLHVELRRHIDGDGKRTYRKPKQA